MSMAWLSWEMKTCLTGKEENIACRKNQLLCKNLVGKGFCFFFFFFNDCFLWTVFPGISKPFGVFHQKKVGVVQLLSHVQLFATPWTTAHQASLFFTVSRSLLKLMSMQSVMPSNHLVLCHPLLFLPSIFPSIRVFPNESALQIR